MNKSFDPMLGYYFWTDAKLNYQNAKLGEALKQAEHARSVFLWNMFSKDSKDLIELELLISDIKKSIG